MSELSVQKFSSFFEEYNYTPTIFYCGDKHRCLFVKMKTDALTTFFIEIPKSFIMRVNPKKYTNIQYIRLSDKENFVEFWGNVDNFNIVGISSYYLYLITDNKHTRYDLVDSLEEVEEVVSKADKISHLEKQSQKFMKKKRTLNPKDLKKEVIPKNAVKIKFKDEKGEEIEDELKGMIESEDGIDSDGDSDEEEDDEMNFYDYDDEEEVELCIVDDLECESDIGQIFLCINLKLLFKRIKSFNKELNQAYIQLEENQMVVNNQKNEENIKMIDDFKVKYEEEYTRLVEENKKDNDQIKRLSSIVSSIKTDTEEANKINTQSLELIKELSEEVIERRDKIHNLLVGVNQYLNDLNNNYF